MVDVRTSAQDGAKLARSAAHKYKALIALAETLDTCVAPENMLNTLMGEIETATANKVIAIDLLDDASQALTKAHTEAARVADRAASELQFKQQEAEMVAHNAHEEAIRRTEKAVSKMIADAKAEAEQVTSGLAAARQELTEVTTQIDEHVQSLHDIQERTTIAQAGFDKVKADIQRLM